jgi:hypothetical protein
MWPTSWRGRGDRSVWPGTARRTQHPPQGLGGLTWSASAAGTVQQCLLAVALHAGARPALQSMRRLLSLGGRSRMDQDLADRAEWPSQSETVRRQNRVETKIVTSNQYLNTFCLHCIQHVFEWRQKMETAEVPAAEGFLSFFMYVYPVYP